jgi:hypothetical protein
MYDAYFEERGLIPEGRLCEVSFEALEREPIGVVRSTYESLGLSGFVDLRPRLEGYLGTIAGYRKNRHDELPEPLRRRIAHEWGRSFDEWGYESWRNDPGQPDQTGRFVPTRGATDEPCLRRRVPDPRPGCPLCRRLLTGRDRPEDR